MADGPPEGYVTSAEACRVLGISDRTLRRRVQAGTIEGEYVSRPQGTVLYVRLPEEAAMYAAQTADAVSAPEVAPSGNQTAETATAPTIAPDATMRALELLAETTQAQIRQIAAQAETIAALSMQIGTLRERAESLAVERAAAMLERDELREDNERLKARRWWRWW